MVETGVVFGRFQIFHLKQMEYVLAAKMRCNRLLIGITHSDIVAFAATSSLDEHGTTRRDNPMTYFERGDMIRGALLDFGIKRKEFEIVPFPISQPDLIAQYVPRDAVYYMSICSDWDEEKYQILQGLGLDVEVLFRRTGEKGVSGTQIRRLIAKNQPWHQHVPKAVAEYVETHGIDARIRELHYRLE